MKQKLQSPGFFLLLPVFFVFHGFVENYYFVPIPDALLLLAVYCGFSVLFLLLAWLFFRNFIKAALTVAFIMGLHFFFGGMHDFLKSISPTFIFAKYAVLLPLAFLSLVVLVVYLKRTRRKLHKLSYLLNILFLVFIVLDIATLCYKIYSKPQTRAITIPPGFSACPSCPTPDIYFIIADEYVSNTTLKEKFGFDNSEFTAELAKRGFHTIPFSKSNYNYTPYSVASTLDMDYLDLRAKIKKNQSDLAVCYSTIRNNRFLQFLESQGYRFYNYSIFDFDGQPARTEVSFLPVKTKLITSQTFLSRFNRDIRFNLVTRLESHSEIKRLAYGFLRNNEQIYELTKKQAAVNDTKPKFVFTHLHLPHYPYYFDKNGKERPLENLVEGNQTDLQAYVGYLQYGNKKYMELIDHITKNSKNPPLVILMGDHGFRHFTTEVESKYYYQNHVSVLLPGKNYDRFVDSLTNVNFFRVLLNTQFSQQLPMLADTTIYIKE